MRRGFYLQLFLSVILTGVGALQIIVQPSKSTLGIIIATLGAIIFIVLLIQTKQSKKTQTQPKEE